MKTITIPATADNPKPMPPHGGNWHRLADGSLLLHERTQTVDEAADDVADEATPQPPADATGQSKE